MAESPWYDGLNVDRAIDTRNYSADRYERINYPDAIIDIRLNEGKAILWIARDEDPTTGTTRDVDGDRSKKAIFMEGIISISTQGDWVNVEGMVEAKGGYYRRESWTQGRSE